MIPKDTQYRTFSVALGRADNNKTSFQASISSEEPYLRGFGYEILDHSENAIDMSRSVDGLPILRDHDTSKPVGMAENLRIVRGRLIADFRFFSTEAGQEALTMVREGFRNVSVGYIIEEVEQEGQRDGFEVYRVKKWTLLEASLVPIPADPTVGVNRSRSIITLKGKRSMETNHGNNEIINEKSESLRVNQIVSTGEAYSRWVTQKDVATAVRENWSTDRFQDFIMAKMESKHTDTRDHLVGMSEREINNYSFGRALVAAMTNDWSKAGLERAASEAVARKFGQSPEGFFVPLDFFRRDFNIGTASEAGNLRPTELRGDLYVDALRNNIVVANMGLRVLSGLTGNVDLPRKATAGTIAALSEIGSASETNPTTAKVTLSPKRFGAYTEVSRQALIQSALALDTMIRDDLLQGAAVLIEGQILNGVGSSNEMTGIRNTSSIGTATAGTNGATLAWSNLVDLESACTNNNANPGAAAGYVTNSKARARAKITPRGTNLDFIIPPDALPVSMGRVSVNGYKCGFTNNVPSNLTKGTSTTVCSAAIFSADWSMGVLGLFGAPDITVDPYSKADTGQIKITLNQFADFGVRQPAAFSKIEDLLT